MKKKPNYFKIILTMLFLIFMGLFIASKSGYYEANFNNKVVLTDKQIEKFEEDVLNGDVMDVNSYILEERKDYSNKFTEAGDKITEVAESFVTDGLQNLYKLFKRLFL